MGRAVTLSEAMVWNQLQRISYVRLQFTDLFGIAKSVEFPAEGLKRRLADPIAFDGSSIEGFVRTEEAQMYLVPDMSTWIELPWTHRGHRFARLLCDVYNYDGTPFAGDPRQVLKRALRRLDRTAGYRLMVKSEIEFYLLPDGSLSTRNVNTESEVHQALAAALLPVEAMLYQVSNERGVQKFRIALEPQEALQAADDLVTCKVLIKTTAHQLGYLATFMPKPSPEMPSLCMYLDHTLMADDACLFFDQTAQSGLSTLAQRFAGGLIDHAPGLRAIFNPLVNSYTRTALSMRQVGDSVPYLKTFLIGQGVAWLRLLTADPSSNPYLTLACIATVGMEGILQGSVQCLSSDAVTHAVLPHDLDRALDALYDDETVQIALGSHVTQHFIEAKELEWRSYQTSVDPWEHAQYFES